MTEGLNLYFDNAATTWPKPEKVYTAAESYLRSFRGNPGRSGHTRTLDAERLIYRTRDSVARLFNASDPGSIVFTLNATDALNMAIKGVLEPGDHIIFTAMDHNSVLRPLGGLRETGVITTTMVPCSEDGFPDLDFMAASFQPRTRLIVFSHASNICGSIVPVGEIAEMAHDKGALILVDAAQSAGVLPIDVTTSQVDMLAFAGHKGLLGPPGTGGLYVRRGLDIKPWREGGTGSLSEQDLHPATMPERLEAGTMNAPGLAGLLEGVEFLHQQGVEKIREHELKILMLMREKLGSIPGITLYGPEDITRSVAVLSLTLKGVDCAAVGSTLESSFNILCRTGLHCAPLAHQALGTFPEGTVRLSPGYFTREEDVEYLAGALREISSVVGSI